MAVEQLIGDANHGNALACVTEGLAAADEQHIVVGVSSDAALIRRLERLTKVFAKVHGEVGKVLQYDGVILGSELSYGPQLVLIEADGAVGTDQRTRCAAPD